MRLRNKKSLITAYFGMYLIIWLPVRMGLFLDEVVDSMVKAFTYVPVLPEVPLFNYFTAVRYRTRTVTQMLSHPVLTASPQY